MRSAAWVPFLLYLLTSLIDPFHIAAPNRLRWLFGTMFARSGDDAHSLYPNLAASTPRKRLNG